MDDLPKDSARIFIFDKKTSLGMFDQHFAVQGEIQYLYGDIADTLDDALAKGGYVSLRPDDGEYAIPVSVEGREIYEGIKWLYEHEYYPILDEDHFPFQTWEYLQLAIGQWCVLLREERKTMTFKEDIIEFVYQDIKFNGKIFKTEWANHGLEGVYQFIGYDVVGI